MPSQKQTWSARPVSGARRSEANRRNWVPSSQTPLPKLPYEGDPFVTNFLPMWRLSAAPATKGRGSSEQAVEPERITQTEKIVWRLAVEPETGVKIDLLSRGEPIGSA